MLQLDNETEGATNYILYDVSGIYTDSSSLNHSTENILVEITMEGAKALIMSLIVNRVDKEAGYGDMMFELGLDLDMIVEACRELEKEGKIKAI